MATHTYEFDGESVLIDIDTGVLGGGEFYPVLTVTMTPEAGVQFRIETCSRYCGDRPARRFPVHHGVELEWSNGLANGATAVADSFLIGELAKELLPHLIVVRDAHEVYWDGSNYKGRVTSAGLDALGTVDELVYHATWADEEALIFTAEDLLRPPNDHQMALGLYEDTWQQDRELLVDPEAAAAALVKAGAAQAEADGIRVHGDLHAVARELVVEAHAELQELSEELADLEA